ncbi:MAG TPA: group I intron-associated PD-(D/E)XK endonuclease [Terriglobales bacterium]|nr:group I intron-associated PD-(D/E)XK endonuclease [Terriglobales bacterium]
MNNPGELIHDPKQRGEWAELCFMAKAASQGLHVSKPYGDTSRYDVGVESGSRILRVQVKSTIYRRRGIESYSLNIHGPRRQLYEEGAVDFFAVYLIPIDTWYIFPFERVAKNFSLHFTPGSKRDKYGRYREAWHLFREPPPPKTCPLTKTSPPPCEREIVEEELDREETSPP